jgi:hypothetical protein
MRELEPSVFVSARKKRLSVLLFLNGLLTCRYLLSGKTLATTRSNARSRTESRRVTAFG